jgi:hypothetical protein
MAVRDTAILTAVRAQRPAAAIRAERRALGQAHTRLHRKNCRRTRHDHAPTIRVAGTPGRSVPLFFNQKESVEHVNPDQRALHSLVRPGLPTVVEPEPQHTRSERQRDPAFFAGGACGGCGRQLAHSLLPLCSVGGCSGAVTLAVAMRDAPGRSTTHSRRDAGPTTGGSPPKRLLALK